MNRTNCNHDNNNMNVDKKKRNKEQKRRSVSADNKGVFDRAPYGGRLLKARAGKEFLDLKAVRDCSFGLKLFA